MLCLACSAWSPNALCRSCLARLAPVPPRRLSSGLMVRAGFRHEGPARSLVHRLKYRGLAPAASMLASGLAGLLPPEAEALVPVPRARLRTWKHGLDPAERLAAELSRLTGVPVVHALRAPLWWPRHAGTDREQRSRSVPFRWAAAPTGAVLVDDVLTTGATLEAAARTCPAVVAAVTATAAGI